MLSTSSSYFRRMSVWMITMLIFIMSPIVLAQHAATITTVAANSAHILKRVQTEIIIKSNVHSPNLNSITGYLLYLSIFKLICGARLLITLRATAFAEWQSEYGLYATLTAALETHNVVANRRIMSTKIKWIQIMVCWSVFSVCMRWRMRDSLIC